VKLIKHFDLFLKDTVNLNQTRIDTLETRVGVIRKFILDSAYVAEIVGYSAQGSWAHQTIIKLTKDGQEFDADLVVFVKPVADWDAKKYILELRRIFAISGTYADKVGMKSRCVTLDYAGDFHLDVVPVVVTEDDWGEPEYLVCNRNENEFEITDGNGFLEWWNGKCSDAGGSVLRKVTRLLKYLRDTKQTFSAKSVLLTTLIGQQVGFLDKMGLVSDFTDVPSGLKAILSRLDDFLQEHEDMPEVENPALEGESFTRNWTDDQYSNFRTMINRYREWVDEAFEEEDRDESIRKWRRVFVAAFAKGETLKKAAAVADNSVGQDVVPLVKRVGAAILERIPRRLPHVQKLKYRRGKSIRIRVEAVEKARKGSPAIRSLTNGDIIQAGSGVEFLASTGSGQPISKDWFVLWQVVNTGQAAIDSACPRGEFNRSDSHCRRFESVQYYGAHWVQAFLINERTQKCDGVSERFFVVVDC